MSDDTETALVPTALAAELPAAYSDYPDDPEPARSPWPTVWGVAAVLLAAALVAAFVIAIVGWAVNKSHEDQPPDWPQTGVSPGTPSWAPVAAPTTISATTVVSLPPTTVTVAAPPPRTVTVTTEAPESTVNVDELYLAQLRAHGLIITDRELAINGAHWACGQFSAGASRQDIIDAAVKANPKMTPAGVVAAVDASTEFYCPKYQGE